MTHTDASLTGVTSEMSSYEVELKLRPRNARLLDHLWELDQVGPFQVIHRVIRHQRNAYLDSPDHALDRAQGNLRWRTLEGSSEGELTYKGPSEVRNGVFRRLEITAVLPTSVDPLTVDPAPEPLLLARKITPHLEMTELVLDTTRRSLELQRGETRIELDLDVTTMPGTAFHDLEIEAELISGDADELSELEDAIAALGRFRRSTKGKRARGWDYREHLSR